MNALKEILHKLVDGGSFALHEISALHSAIDDLDKITAVAAEVTSRETAAPQAAPAAPEVIPAQ